MTPFARSPRATPGQVPDVRQRVPLHAVRTPIFGQYIGQRPQAFAEMNLTLLPVFCWRNL